MKVMAISEVLRAVARAKPAKFGKDTYVITPNVMRECRRISKALERAKGR